MFQNSALILCCTYSKYICLVVVQHQIKQHGLEAREKPAETELQITSQTRWLVDHLEVYSGSTFANEVCHCHLVHDNDISDLPPNSSPHVRGHCCWLCQHQSSLLLCQSWHILLQNSSFSLMQPMKSFTMSMIDLWSCDVMFMWMTNLYLLLVKCPSYTSCQLVVLFIIHCYFMQW